MKLTPLERRWRDALMLSVLPGPIEGLPDFDCDALDAFWPRFERVAPLHLQLALRAAVVALAAVMPRLSGHLRGLDGLDAESRDAVLRRADELPLFADLVEVVKIVACFAYFEDPAVQAAARTQP